MLRILRYPPEAPMPAQDYQAPQPDGRFIELGNLRFTKERVEKLRSGTRVLSISRAGVRRARLDRNSGSEYPMREALWAVGTALVGTVTARSAFVTHSVSEIGIAAVLYLVSGWLVVHLLQRILILTLETDQGPVRIDAETKLSREQIGVFRRRIRTELEWPID